MSYRTVGFVSLAAMACRDQAKAAAGSLAIRITAKPYIRSPYYVFHKIGLYSETVHAAEPQQATAPATEC